MIATSYFETNLETVILDIIGCVCYTIIEVNDCVRLGEIYPYGVNQLISFFVCINYISLLHIQL